MYSAQYRAETLKLFNEIAQMDATCSDVVAEIDHIKKEITLLEDQIQESKKEREVYVI